MESSKSVVEVELKNAHMTIDLLREKIRAMELENDLDKKTISGTNYLFLCILLISCIV